MFVLKLCFYFPPPPKSTSAEIEVFALRGLCNKDTEKATSCAVGCYKPLAAKR